MQRSSSVWQSQQDTLLSAPHTLCILLVASHLHALTGNLVHWTSNTYLSGPWSLACVVASSAQFKSIGTWRVDVWWISDARLATNVLYCTDWPLIQKIICLVFVQRVQFLKGTSHIQQLWHFCCQDPSLPPWVLTSELMGFGGCDLILGDPGAVSRAGRKGATKVFKHGRKSPWVPTLTGPFPNGQANAGSWLDTKNALYYFAHLANSISGVLFASSYTTAIDSITACLAHAPKKCTHSGNFQFDIDPPFQNTVYPKTKGAFPTIQAWAYNRYSRFYRSRLRKY